MRRSASEPAAREWARDLAAGSTAGQPGRSSQRLRPSYTVSPAGQRHFHRKPLAGIHAVMRADEMLERVYVEGYAVWKRVVKAVQKSLRE